MNSTFWFISPIVCENCGQSVILSTDLRKFLEENWGYWGKLVIRDRTQVPVPCLKWTNILPLILAHFLASVVFSTRTTLSLSFRLSHTHFCIFIVFNWTFLSFTYSYFPKWELPTIELWWYIQRNSYKKFSSNYPTWKDNLFVRKCLQCLIWFLFTKTLLTTCGSHILFE